MPVSVDLGRRHRVGKGEDGCRVVFAFKDVALAGLDFSGFLGVALFLFRAPFRGTDMPRIDRRRPTVVQRVANGLLAFLAARQADLAEPRADAVLRGLVVLDERINRGLQTPALGPVFPELSDPAQCWVGQVEHHRLDRPPDHQPA